MGSSCRLSNLLIGQGFENSHRAYKNEFECYHYLDKLCALGFQNESRNVTMRAKFPLVKAAFLPRNVYHFFVLNSQLSPSLASLCYSPLAEEAASLAPELTLAKVSSDQKPYSYQKERSGISCVLLFSESC